MLSDDSPSIDQLLDTGGLPLRARHRRRRSARARSTTTTTSSAKARSTSSRPRSCGRARRTTSRCPSRRSPRARSATTTSARCRAYRGCERLRGSSGPPSRLWVCHDSRLEGGPGCSFTANAKLGLAGRLALVRGGRGRVVAAGGGGRVQRLAGDGASLVAALARGERSERASLACLLDRSSRPRRIAAAAAASSSSERICAAGADRLGAAAASPARPGIAHSTVWKVLQPARALAAAAAAARAGQPLRVALPRRSAAHGRLPLRALPAARPRRHRRPPQDRRRRRETRVGYDYAHAIVDDHTPPRLRRAPRRRDSAATVTGFVERALAFFAAHGITPKRLMTDNAFTTSRTARCASCSPTAASGTCTTQPYRPRTNGKVERFHQTMAREWAYGLPTAHTDTAPPPCHTGSTTTTRRTTQLARRPTPISRVHNLRRQDT